jgi:putative phosphoesterase
MNVAIISDIHDNIPNLTKVLNYCHENKAEKIICCGDLGSLETLDFLNDNFAGEIFFTFGNMDNDYLKNYSFENNCYKNTLIFKNFGEIRIENKKIAFVHFPREARALCETGTYNFVFHGHTHKPWSEIINNCTLLNPGNVANQIYPPAFAIWDVEQNKFDLIRINDLK